VKLLEDLDIVLLAHTRRPMWLHICVSSGEARFVGEADPGSLPAGQDYTEGLACTYQGISINGSKCLSLIRSFQKQILVASWSAAAQRTFLDYFRYQWSDCIETFAGEFVSSLTGS
jgi:hypothetical protein